MANVTTSSIITLIRGIIKDIQKTNGKNAFDYDSDSSFKLSEENASATGINVYQNTTLMSTDDWSYNSDTNEVTITPVTSGVSLTKNDNIIITFNYYDKYSDTEITSYIKANLARFTQKRYSKTFYMNDSNEVVNSSGENPTEKEGNVIALITAIDIDPQNVKIRTPDFTIDASESKSKSQQIDDILNQFMRNFGDVDFMELED